MVFVKLKYLSSKLADVVRATQSFFATHSSLWHMLKSHWLSRLIGPIFLIGATFGVIDAFNNYKKAQNKSFDKIFALASLSAFQLTLFMGIVIAPIATMLGASGILFYTPAWVILALTLNTAYLLCQSLNYHLRGLSHQDVFLKQENASISLSFLQKGLAAGLMSSVLALLQLSSVNPILISTLALASTITSLVCLSYDFFKHKKGSVLTAETLPKERVFTKTTNSNQLTNHKPLFAHANRRFHIQHASKSEAKLYLSREINTKIGALQRQEPTLKRDQKINLLSELLSGLDGSQIPCSKSEIRDKYPLAFQSLSIFTGKSDVEDVYDACQFYSEQHLQAYPHTMAIEGSSLHRF